MNATYRLQLTPDFGFAEAEALVSYLKRLGVSHLYLSPITEAHPGSTHGYDVINPRVGTLVTTARPERHIAISVF